MSKYAAFDVNSERTYGNFKPDRYQARPPRWKTRKELREGNSREHLALIRQLPCCICGTKGTRAIHAHHLRSEAAARTRGVGMKAPDSMTVPLCWLHHDELHALGSRREVQWFKDQCEINPHALADSLWNNTGDLTRLHRVLQAFHDDARKRIRACQAGR